MEQEIERLPIVDIKYSTKHIKDSINYNLDNVHIYEKG